MHKVEDRYTLGAIVDSLSLREDVGHVFLKGWYENQRWFSLFCRPSAAVMEAVRPHLCDGELGSMEIRRWPSGEVVAIFQDRKMIASVCVIIADHVPTFLERS